MPSSCHADAFPAELGEGRKHVDVPGARRFRLEHDERPHERGDLVEAAEIVGIVEPVADEAGGDLASDLGDDGVAVGEAALSRAARSAADFEDRLSGRLQRAPQICGQAFTGDVDEHG